MIFHTNYIFRLGLRRNTFYLIQHLSRPKSMTMADTIAVCQFTATNDKAQNLKTIQKFVKYANEQKATMVFLPEASDFMATSDLESKNSSEPLDGPLMSEYKKLACENSMWLSIGGFHELQHNSGNSLHFNSHVIINNKGKIEGVYRKIHLFDVQVPEKKINLKESNMTNPGMEIVPPIKTPLGDIGLAICYDLRFPELSTILRKMGATILTFPSAFTVPTGEAHWKTLLKARAIENQCYVVAAAQYGCHNEKRKSFGQSLVIDPWGEIVGEGIKYSPNIPTNEEVILVTIDKNMSKNVQEKMPVFNHRRNDLYQLVPTKVPSTNLSKDYMFSDKVIPKSTVFYATAYSYAFTNIRCVVPGHVLVASTRPAKRLEDLSTIEANDFFQTVIKIQKVVEKVYGSNSSTICVQDGPDAGQTIAHVHCHILPRKAGDFPKNDNVYHELANHDKRDNDPIRSLAEMSKEAELLRKNL